MNMNLQEFESNFKTKEQCLYFLAKHGYQNFKCKKCNGNEAWITKEYKYKCKALDCNYQVSITNETAFYNSHIPLNLWFKAIWYVTSNEKKVSASFLQKNLTLGSNNTANRLFKKLNKLMMKCKPHKLSGTIEIYWKQIITPSKEQLYLIVAVELNMEKLNYFHVEALKVFCESDIYDFLKNNVHSDSILLCKKWYDIFNKDYHREVIQQWKHAPDIICNIEKWILGIKLCNKKNITLYLNKYSIKNKKYRPKITFQDLIYVAGNICC